MLRQDAGAAVCHFQQHRLGVTGASGNGKRSPVGHGITGIHDKIHQHLQQLMAIQIERGKIGGNGELWHKALEKPLPFQHGKKVFQELLHVDPLYLRLYRPCIVKQILHQPVDPAGIGSNPAQIIAFFPILCQLLGQNPAVADDTGKRCPYFMGHAGGQEPYRRHLFRAERLQTRLLQRPVRLLQRAQMTLDLIPPLFQRHLHDIKRVCQP